MFPMDRKALNAPVVVEYELRGERVRKELPNAFAARSFYARMFKAGRSPRVVYKQCG